MAFFARGSGTAFHGSLVSSEIVPSKSRHSRTGPRASWLSIKPRGSGTGVCEGSGLLEAARLKAGLHGECPQKFCRPYLEVVMADFFPQRMHPFGARLRAHLERLAQTIGDRVGIIRIHQ